MGSNVYDRSKCFVKARFADKNEAFFKYLFASLTPKGRFLQKNSAFYSHHSAASSLSWLVPHQVGLAEKYI